MIHPYEVLVIGGGVSGMTAAVAAARTGNDVILLEGSDHIGGKLLDTASFSRYFTNEKVSAEHFYDADPSFVQPVLDQFSAEDLADWMREIGLDLKSENGCICPVSGQAADILDILRLQMNRYFVRVERYQKVIEIAKQDDLFVVTCLKSTFHAKKVVLAAGTKAVAQTDSGDSGYRLAETLGMEVKKPLPALTSLRLATAFGSEWDGLCCQGEVKLIVDGQEKAGAAGLMELTNYGISGVPAYQVSRCAARALDEGREVRAVLSFLPGRTTEEAFEFLKERVSRVGDYLAREFLIGVLPKKLARILIRQAGIRHSRPIHYLKDNELRRLAEVLTAYTTEVTGHGNFRQSLTCTGGVLTSEADPQTLESRKVKGLYLAGELLDVDGMYEGYNSQWAFSSGFAAGTAAGHSQE